MNEHKRSHFLRDTILKNHEVFLRQIREKYSVFITGDYIGGYKGHT
jgi:hypothetical protein